MLNIDQNIKIAVDSIVFGYSENELKVLLVKQKYGELKGSWALVGGFVKDNESLEVAVVRELKEEAGISVNYLEQLYTFGDDIHRDPRGRVISVAYFALVNEHNFILHPSTDAEEAAWFPINDLPTLAYDHSSIISLARTRLKSKLTYQPIGFDLLPEKFLFSDLEQLYSTLLEVNIDRRNFRKKIISFDLLEETGDLMQQGAGRPAKLFKFNSEKYKELTKKGFLFEINLV